MRVTRLEIFGFKSFVDRFVLNFDKNMIGIIGPNGCGKSNVVDSLRWVLGETHAKQLRGGSFDDLIFNGSDSRRQLGMAEVSLTIRPSENWKSKIEEEGPEELSEYQQLEKIIQDTDTNNTEESVVTEETLSSSPVTESPSKISLISEKVASFPGLFEASEIQFTRRLYRSGESEYFINKVPCRLRDMQDLYRLIGLGARGLSIVQQGQIGQFISKKPIERRELLEEAAGISGFRNKMEAATRRLEKTDENLARVSDILIEVEKQVKNLRRQASRAKARQSLKDELTACELELYGIKGQLLNLRVNRSGDQSDTIQQQIDDLRAALTEKEASIAEREAGLHEIEVSLVSLRREKDENAKAIYEEENRLQDIRLKIASLDGEESNLKNRLDQDRQRLNKLVEEKSALELELAAKKQIQAEYLEKLASEKEILVEQERNNQIELENFQNAQSNQSNENPALSEVSLKILELSKRIEGLEGELSLSGNLHQEVTQSSQNLKSKERHVFESERAVNKIRSEIQAIEKQLSSLAQHTLKATSGDEETAKVLLSFLRIPAEYEKAVHAIIGEKVNFLVTQDSDEMLRSYKNRSGVSTRVGVLSESVKSLETQKSQISLPEGISTLISEIDFDQSKKNLVDSLLINTWVANDLDTALRFRDECLNQNVANFSIVLPSGEVLNPCGWNSTVGEGLHLSFARRLAELSEEESQAILVLEGSKADHAESELSLNEIKQKLEHVNSMRSELASAQKEVSNCLKIQSNEERKHYQLVQEQERSLREALRAREREQSQKVSSIEKEMYAVSSQINVIESRLKKIDEEHNSINGSLNSYSERFDKIQMSRNELLLSTDQVNNSLNSEESQNKRLRLSEVESIIDQEETKRLNCQQDLGQVRQEISHFRREIESNDRELRNLESDRDRAKIELEMLEQDFLRYYPENSFTELLSQNLLQESSDVNVQQVINKLTETSNSIRRRLEREGEVDPQSIELCEIEEARLTSITTQSKDLVAAKEILEKTIKQLKELSRIRFLNTFHAVNAKFKELVPRLFSGGSGHLELVNPDDPLQSGVEIVVRPPGKKITTMELMSGGEKALIATAVLVSMFLHHPGPICVLDEIDAPLDDANLVKLLELVKEIADKTQFLVITHNKITMQAVDRIIGITMQESGVTTALSVTLDEAEQELEKMVVNG